MSRHSFRSQCPDWATALCNGFSQIFLQHQPLCGVLCLLAIAVGAPHLLGGALLGGVAGLLTAQRRGYPKADRQAGLYSYNGILLGLLLSHHLPWSALLPLLIIASAGLSAMLTQQWLKRASHHQSLSLYTLPFVGLSWLILGHASPASTAVAPAVAFDWLSGLFGGFKGLGQVMLLDSALAGLLIAIGLWLANWRAACWALFGAFAGMLFSGLQHDPASAISGLGGYNAALAALALSQQRSRPWLPLTGIVLALLLTPGFASLGLPALTAPFILAGWLVQSSCRVLSPVAQGSSEASGLRIER